MGADNLQNLHKWKNSTELLRLCPILVYPRPGFPNENPHIAGDISVIDAPLMEISSSFIRQSIANYQDVRFSYLIKFRSLLKIRNLQIAYFNSIPLSVSLISCFLYRVPIDFEKFLLILKCLSISSGELLSLNGKSRFRHF